MPNLTQCNSTSWADVSHFPLNWISKSLKFCVVLQWQVCRKLVFSCSTGGNVQPLWKTVWQFLKKRTMHLTHNPVFLGIRTYAREMTTNVYIKTCIWIFIALFVIAKNTVNKPDILQVVIYIQKWKTIWQYCSLLYQGSSFGEVQSDRIMDVIAMHHPYTSLTIKWMHCSELFL